MVNEGLDFFGGAPRFTNQPINIGPKHGKGVVNAKQRVADHFFEFTLTNDAALFPFKLSLFGPWKHTR